MIQKNFNDFFEVLTPERLLSIDSIIENVSQDKTYIYPNPQNAKAFAIAIELLALYHEWHNEQQA